MLDKLKADFDRILELVNKTPQPLRETAFKMILERWFATNIAPSIPLPVALPAGSGPQTPGAVPGRIPDSAEPFLTANGVTSEILEAVFHPTGPGAQLVASAIPGNSKASKLVSLSFLLCVKEALESGAFRCSLKYLREMAVHYDCYDSASFSGTLKANRSCPGEFRAPRRRSGLTPTSRCVGSSAADPADADSRAAGRKDAASTTPITTAALAVAQ